MSEKPKSVSGDEKSAATSWNSPSGLDLNPRPPKTVRISRRASLSLVALVVILLGLFAYGGWKRRQRQVAALADANLPKRVAPATAAAADIVKDVPTGNVLAARTQRSGTPVVSGQLQAPEDVLQYTPQSGAGNGTAAPATAYVRQVAPVQASAPPVQQVQQPTPEEQRIQAAYESEQRAMVAPTGLHDGFGGASVGPPPDADSPHQLNSALQSVPSPRPGRVTSPDQNGSSRLFKKRF